MAKTIAQNYPRIQDEKSPYHGCLDDSQLIPHTNKIDFETLKSFIRQSIENANRKSSRQILSVPSDATDDEAEIIYHKEGSELFKYFHKYTGDPASTAHQVYGKHVYEVGRELFRNRTLQKERMNSGWRYQYLAIACASKSERFIRVSDIAQSEGDFNAVIGFIDSNRKPLSLYVSVKNRQNTMGGQDWPKAIHALEDVAKNDKNKAGPYCCVFGIAMDFGLHKRLIKRHQKTKNPHSMNTEVWMSNYFWPFFSNYSYEEIMTAVLDVLKETHQSTNLSSEILIPETLLRSFEQCCYDAQLIDDEGKFNDSYTLVKFFVNKLPRRK